MAYLDPSYDIQAAVFTALSNTAVINSSLNGTVTLYDFVPQNPSFPFVSIGDDHVMLGDVYDYSKTSDVAVNVHVFSRAKGKPDVKKIAGAVRQALEVYLPINNFTTLTYKFIDIRYLTESDGLTQHAIVRFEYEVKAN